MCLSSTLFVVAGRRSWSVGGYIGRRLFPIGIAELWLDTCTPKGTRHHVVFTACVDRQLATRVDQKQYRKTESSTTYELEPKRRAH